MKNWMVSGIGGTERTGLLTTWLPGNLIIMMVIPPSLCFGTISGKWADHPGTAKLSYLLERDISTDPAMYNVSLHFCRAIQN